MKAIISEKGQVTIPQLIREQLGLKPGQTLDFETKNGVLIAKKHVSVEGIDEVVGILSTKVKNVDNYLEETRGFVRQKKE